MTPIEAAWQHRAPDLEGMTTITNADLRQTQKQIDYSSAQQFAEQYLHSKPDPFANIAITPPTWWQLLKRFWREL